MKSNKDKILRNSVYKTIQGKGFIASLVLNGVSISRKNDATPELYAYDEKLKETIPISDSNSCFVVFPNDVCINQLSDNRLIYFLFKKNNSRKVAPNEVLNYSIDAFLLGTFFKGSYSPPNGCRFTDTSRCIEFPEMDENTLISLAEDMVKTVQPASLLVKSALKNSYLIEKEGVLK